MCWKLVSQLALNKGHNKKTPFVLHIPQNHRHKKFNTLQPIG